MPIARLALPLLILLSTAPTAHAKKKPPPPGPKAPPAESSPPSASAPRMSYVTVVGFDGEPVGDAPRKLQAKTGDWTIAEVGGARGLQVEGKGDSKAEALAIYQGACDGDERTLSVRFLPIDGKVAQSAAFVFALRPDGNHFAVAANALDGTLTLEKVARGKRTVLQAMKDVVARSADGHSLALRFKGRDLTVELDGEERFTRKLDAAPTGKCGLAAWADSKILFDEFKVSIAAAAR